MTAAEPVLPELLTADDARVRACTAGGVDHDYRTYTRQEPGRTTSSGQVKVMFVPNVETPSAPTAAELTAAVPLEGVTGATFTHPRTYLRCVWCHGVTCGNADETDPCIEPYHHRVPHRTRLGTTWPIGGDRPNPKETRR